MSGSYHAGERRALEQQLRDGEPLHCPACGAELSVQDVRPPGAVSYVRRRVWVVCTACRRTASLDMRNGPGSGPTGGEPRRR